MPFCVVGRGAAANGIRIYYRRYGRGRIKVLLIIGLAGTHHGWGPQVKGLTGVEEPNSEEEEEGREDGIEVCCFDNRGMGRSSVPTKKSSYTTTIMAKDALSLLDHLGWEKAHVFGHSMGAMIACKLAAMAPDRLSSLALLNTSGGGYECLPKIDYQIISLAICFLRAKTPEERATIDLEVHYTKEYLDERVGTSSRRKDLYQQYVQAISSTGMQSSFGFEGQVNACWTHNMTTEEFDVIRSGGFLVLIIHGRYDIVAQVCHARKLANLLKPVATLVELQGAHLVSHERPDEVNHFLLKLIRATEAKTNLRDCLRLAHDEYEPSAWNKNDGLSITSASSHDVMSKLQLSILYLFGVFIVAFEQARRAIRLLKPVRIGASLR